MKVCVYAPLAALGATGHVTRAVTLEGMAYFAQKRQVDQNRKKWLCREIRTSVIFDVDTDKGDYGVYPAATREVKTESTLKCDTRRQATSVVPLRKSYTFTWPV
ncbi:TPA: hypothetical protein ACH3X1_011797 [Trebouxia sp. C0004]